MSGILQMLVGKKMTPDMQAREWKQKIRREERTIDRDIRQITQQEAVTRKQCQQLAKKGDLSSCRILAKELIRSQKAKDRLVTSKAHLNSLAMQIGELAATAKVVGSLQKSTEVMKVVNKLIKVGQISQVMQEMSQEMMKAGIMDEMMQDALEGLDEDGIEEEAEEEVDKVLFEITNGLLGEAGSVGAPLEAEKKQKELERRMQGLKSI